ncbi:MAG: hypothetical protein M1835_000325 [Candelina submexicana]|nr:MAG: hypothetical protein M1835_000325 [Candelina submexicana]
MAYCRPHPCPGLNARAVWNPTLQLCDCAPLQIRPLEPGSPILDTRSVVTSCRHLRCPLGAQAFWDPVGKTCICPTLPKMPIPHHPATVSKNLPTTETKSAEFQLDTRDPDAACPPLVCPLGASALWNRAQKKCNCAPTPKLIADDTSDSADLSESTEQPTPTSADIPSITTEPSTSIDDLSQFIKRGDVVEKTASSLTLPTHAPRAENPLDNAAHLADRGIQVLRPAKTLTPAKINPNSYPPPKLARRDTTATAANPIWTPEGLSEQFLKDVAAFQAASFEDKAKLGPKFVFKTLNRVDHGFPPTATNTGKVEV